MHYNAEETAVITHDQMGKDVIENISEAMAGWDGREPSTLSNIAKTIAEAGYMPGVKDWTAAANLLIALSLPDWSEMPALGVPIFRSLKREDRLSSAPPYHAFREVAAALTFGEAIEAMLRNAPRIRQWFVQRQQPSDAVGYIANYTCALRVVLKSHFLPHASILVNRKMDEPTYHLEFWCTEETVALAADHVPPDREVEISVGLPTLLTLAGAVLGQDLIEDEPSKGENSPVRDG